MHMSHGNKSDRRDKSHSDRRMREKEIEQKLVKAVKGRGGICPKLVCPAYAGMPDRMALIPGGRVGFVEVKAPGKVPRPLQLARHTLLRQLGFQVYVLDEPAAIPMILDAIEGGDAR